MTRVLETAGHPCLRYSLSIASFGLSLILVWFEMSFRASCVEDVGLGGSDELADRLNPQTDSKGYKWTVGRYWAPIRWDPAEGSGSLEAMSCSQLLLVFVLCSLAATRE